MINTLETGGTERQFTTVARSFDPSTFRVHLGCLRQRGAFLDDFADVPMPEFPPSGSLYGIPSWISRLRLARHLRSVQPSIVHSFDFYTNLMLVPTARLAGVPVVIGSQRQLGDLLSPAQNRVQSIALRLCDAVICNSNAAAAGLSRHGISESRIKIVRNALPAAAFEPIEPALARRPGVTRIGLIARMNTRAKNHSQFLRIAARLKDKLPHLEFILAGDGPLRRELEDEASRLGLSGRVSFLGDRRDVPAVIASLDLMVLPSTSESLSNAIIESMAGGIPVVAYHVGGNAEVISDGVGVLVRDEEEMANVVEQLLLDPQRRRDMGRRAREFAQEEYSLERIRRCYEAIYAELLETSSGRKVSSGNRRPPVVSSARRRVVIIAASLRYVGGQSAQADLLLRQWTQDPEVQTEFIPIDPVLPQGLRWVQRIRGLRTLVREPVYLANVWRGVMDAEIAHIFAASFWSFLIAPAPAWFIARLLGKKTVMHYHSGEAPDHLRRFRSARYVLKRVDSLVVPSAYLKRVFGESGIHAQVVPNVAEPARFRFRERKPLRPRFVCTRGFHSYYCVDVVVRAFAEIKKSYPDASLDLAGGGPVEQEIARLVRQFNLDGVNFTGIASRDEIPLLYEKADIFLNASMLDNMPVSILEAFASGTPVVSTAPDGIRYMVEHERTGLLSEVGNPSALAGNAMRLLRNPELASQIAACAHSELRQYSWETVRDQWMRVYGSLNGR